MPPKGPAHKFIAVDVLILMSAVVFAVITWLGIPPNPPNIILYRYLLIPILLMRLVIHYTYRLYDFRTNNNAVDVLYNTFCAVTLGSLLELCLLQFAYIYYAETFATLLPEADVQLSRPVIVLTWLYSLIGAGAWRLMYLRRRRRWAYDRTRVLIVGAGEIAETIRQEIEKYSKLGHEVVGFIDDEIDSMHSDSQSDVLGKLHDLLSLVQELRIDEIIVTSSKASRGELLSILSHCERSHAKVRMLPELYETMIGRVEVGQVAGIPMIEIRRGELPPWCKFWKRTMDLIVASVSLVILSPLWLGIWIAVKLSAPKSKAIYEQPRIGQDGKSFILYKFRTMIPDAEAKCGPVLASENDPRITPIGGFLRRWNLDELPQFYNVLRGDMSLVGPRPERPVFVEEYVKENPTYELRSQVRPGMTGLAQIHGLYNSSVYNKLRYDLSYINNVSFLLDLKILILTMIVTLTGRRRNV